MLKIQPTSSCCVCFSLLVGVEVIAVPELIICALVVALASSKEPIHVAGLSVSPIVQISAAAWALIGIPIIVGAAGTAMYRVEWLLRWFFRYLAATLVVVVVCCAYLFGTGKMCGTVAPEEAQRLGMASICTIVDTAALFYVSMLILLRLYSMYIVWSAAEEAAHTLPPLMPYSDKRQPLKTPQEPKAALSAGKAPPPGRPSAAAAYDASVVGPPVNVSYGSTPQQQAPTMPLTMPPPGPPQPVESAIMSRMPMGMPQQQPPTGPLQAPTRQAGLGSSSMWSSQSQGEPQSFAPAPPSGFS